MADPYKMNPRRFHDNELEHTPQSIGSWWAGIRENENEMVLADIQFLLDGAEIHMTVKGKHKSLQISESHHASTVPMAVGRAVFGVLEVQRCLEELNIRAAEWKREVRSVLGA